ncbi:type II secretion system protein N [Thiomicrospira microaerophila]|uniref:type II secretion system protein N n=1 Tax=Thiomicrospira microaerophila TaxID=406020 RepID=UPI0005C8B279|nr:type II secretion system protein N [Thiomicrospira microaerophila]
MNFSFSELVVSRWSGSLAGLMAFLLLLVMAWQLGGGLAQTLEQPAAPVLPDLKPVALEREPVSSPIALWGQVPPSAPASRPQPRPVAPPPTPVQPIRDTRLNVKLLGVINAQPVGVAIIQAGRDTKVLSVGELLQSNVTLVEIGRDFVILQNRQQRERLSMDDAAAGLMVAAEQTSQAKERAPVESPVSGYTPQQSALAPEQAQQLQSVSREVRENPMRIGQYVRFEPLRERDAWLGIRIGARNHPEIFGALGFREGDLVTSINGLSVAEMAQNPAVWNRFLQESRFSLVVNRNGLEETIEVDLSQ